MSSLVSENRYFSATMIVDDWSGLTTSPFSPTKKGPPGRRPLSILSADAGGLFISRPSAED